MNDLESRIKRGRRAIALAKERGVDTSVWEKELTRLEALPQAEEVARHTEELLESCGWCLWRCEAMKGEIIAVAKDEGVKSIPPGVPVYTEAEMESLFSGEPVRRSTLRLVDEAKRLAGARVISRERASGDRL
jgi:hypothetical protein